MCHRFPRPGETSHVSWLTHTSAERLLPGEPFLRGKTLTGLTVSSWSETISKQLTESTNTAQSHQLCSTTFLSMMLMWEIRGEIQSTVSLFYFNNWWTSTLKQSAEKKIEMVFEGEEIPGKREWRRIKINWRERRKRGEAAKQLQNCSTVENTMHCCCLPLCTSSEF